ncbi:methylated-DNA--[protein]-cysteine S-methyltransferase [Maledivibacter halophilus]|uniref:Methylated-DNA--protein-cysteine methyltransferase n=1 Tax=Maledivibacter halophilus TaxID=36842 RepID=A0A1T5L2H4_9FIRM|nr:methylated-DNA--[protein]-cysteine S-methyltransferase [Maledivibacter halophilus]SKC70256.1 methylated-DNA-[protein]-cysteine S-methyltransferase [Maledivibacter halophilus]
MYYTRFNTSFCEIILVGDKLGLRNLHLNTGEGNRSFEISKNWILNDDFFEDSICQIKEFLCGKRKVFNIKLNLEGTDFQKSVWKELCKIPYGRTTTYKEIAKKLGNENASRAVGAANGKNPIPLIIPCHRVIGSNGKLTGFAYGIAIKEKIINHEKSKIGE